MNIRRTHAIARPVPIVAFVCTLASLASAAGTILLEEGFEGAWPPPGWAVHQGGDTHTWDVNEDVVNSGARSAWLRFGAAGSTQDEWLISPTIDLSGVTTAMLEFHEDEAYWDFWGGRHYIMVSTVGQDDIASFQSVYLMLPTNHEIAGFGGEPVHVDLSAFAGEPEVWIAFRYEGSFADHWYVDDVSIYDFYYHDVAVTSLIPEAGHFAGGHFIVPRADMENRGVFTEFNLRMRRLVRTSGVVTLDDTVVVNTVEPGATITGSFPVMILDPGQWYEFEAGAVLVSDEHPVDNVRTARIDSWTGQRVPLGVLVTNNECHDCVQAEAALDELVSTLGDSLAVLQVHTGVPGPDAIHDANPVQSDWLAERHGAGPAPCLCLDGEIHCGSVGADYVSCVAERAELPSPMTIDLHWETSSSRALVRVDVVEPVPHDEDMRLRLAVVEDDVDELGGNGLRYHDRTFRHLYPDTAGVAFTPTDGLHEFVIPVALDPAWNVDALHLIAWIEAETNRVVHQATAKALGDASYAVATDAVLPALRLERVSPNPFNPAARIAFELGTPARTRVALYDAAGRRVRVLTCVSGPLEGRTLSIIEHHRVIWRSWFALYPFTKVVKTR